MKAAAGSGTMHRDPGRWRPEQLAHVPHIQQGFPLAAMAAERPAFVRAALQHACLSRGSRAVRCLRIRPVNGSPLRHPSRDHEGLTRSEPAHIDHGWLNNQHYLA